MSLRKFLLGPSAKILASAGLLLVASRLLNWHDMADAVGRLDVWHVFLASVAAIAALLLLAGRWMLMAREIDSGMPIRHFRHFLFGVCISGVTPANIGNDVYRFAMLRRDGKSWSIIGLLVQEKILLLIGYLLSIIGVVGILGLSGGILVHSHRVSLFGMVGLAALGVAAPFVLPSMIIYFSRRWRLAGRRADMLDGFRRLIALGPPRRYLPLLGLSLLSIVSWLVAVTVVAARLDPPLPLPIVWLIAIVADIVRWAPFSLQGIGVREGAFAAMFLFFGADPAQGFALGGIAYLIVTLAMVAAGGVAVGMDLVATLVPRMTR